MFKKLIKLSFCLLFALLIIRTLDFTLSVNASVIKVINLKSELYSLEGMPTYVHINSTDQQFRKFRKSKRSDLTNFDLNLESNDETDEMDDDEDQLNQTRIMAEELINKKKKEIQVSQQILLVLCFGFIVLIIAISKIMLNMGNSIDNRKYLLVN